MIEISLSLSLSFDGFEEHESSGFEEQHQSVFDPVPQTVRSDENSSSKEHHLVTAWNTSYLITLTPSTGNASPF